MLKKKFYYFLTLLALFSFVPKNVLACDSCGCTLAKISENVKSGEQGKPWFFDFTVEQQQWKIKDPHDAHILHHQGHEFHDKTHEEFYHYTFGVNPLDRFTLLAELPYVVRGSLDVEHHATLGRKQQSEGIGDLNLIGVYKLLVKDDDFLGISGGVKFPTGETKELDPYGDRFEPELQPGSGSYDYPIGIVYRHTIKPFVLSGNVSYVIKTKGSQEFEYGDLFFASMNVGYVLNPQNKAFQTKIGLDMTLQHAQKDSTAGVRDDDSGETSLFIGPGVNIKASDNISIFGNIQFPTYQTTGGVHQKLDYVWTAGAKINW